MNRYSCVRCGDNWFSASVVLSCPRCGGEMVYAGPAGMGDDEKKGGKALVEEMAAYAAEPEISGGGKDDKMIPLCPLSLEKCKEEKCAWWHETEIVCAVKLIAIRLRK